MARDRVIPNAVILNRDPTGQVPPQDMNDAAKKADRQLLFAGRDSLIPIIYGGPVRVAGLLYTARIYQPQQTLVLVQILCEGPVEQIAGVELDDEVLAASGSPTSNGVGGTTQQYLIPSLQDATKGVSVTTYTGAAGQGVDPILAAAIPGFAETLAGTAYAVIQVARGISQGFPRFTFEVKGLKVWNPRGKALDFDAGEQISRASAAALNFGTGSFTVEGRFWHDDITTFPKTTFPVSKHGPTWNTSPGWGIGQAVGTTDLQFAICDGTNLVNARLACDAGYRPTDWVGKWVHLALAVDRTAGLARLYVEGVLQSGTINIASVTGSVDNSQPLAAGITVGWQLDGKMDELRLWNVARTQEQIRAYKDVRALGTEANLALCWHMDEGTGTSVADATANALTGTFSGTPAWVTGYPLGPPASGTKVWSDNPALCLADYLNNDVYGERSPVNWVYAAEAADYCDEIVTGAGGSEKRALLALALAERREHKENRDTLRAYVPAWVDYEGDTALIIADKPRAVDHVLTAAAIDINPLPKLRKRGVRDTPNIVEIGYTKTDVKPWAKSYAPCGSNPATRRKARIDMPGIQRFSQATRFAVERVNHYNLEDLEGSTPVFENGLKVILGDRCQITDDIGLTSKDVRVLDKEDRGGGYWMLHWREYDPAAYSSTVQTTPTTADLGLPNPRIVASPTNLQVVENVFLEKVTGSTLAGGLIYQSRFDCTWTAAVHPYSHEYRIELWDGATRIREEFTVNTSYSTPAVQQGKSYTLKVFTRNKLGYESPPVTASPAALGKLLPPGPIQGITRATEIGGEIFIDYLPAIDIDITRYEWRYYANGTGSWDTATLIDRVDGLSLRKKGLPTGTHRFYGKAIDSVGNYSTSAVSADITVTSDSNAFLQDHEFTNPFTTGAELTPEGDFSSSAGWTLGPSATISGGKLNVTGASAGSAVASRSAGIVSGKLYKVQLTLDSISSGAVRVATSADVESVSFTAAGTYVAHLAASASSDGSIYILAADGTTTAVLDNLSVVECNNIIEWPQLEGVWKKRWATSVLGQTFNQAVTGTVNAVSTPIIRQHASGKSRFIDQTPWNLGAVMSGDWTLTPNATILNGTATYGILTSLDGVTYTLQPGVTYKGAAQYILPYIDLDAAGTMIVTPPKVRLAALPRSESGLATTLSSGGKLIEFVNGYALAQDVQVTPANTSASRTTGYDRLLLHPERGLLHQFSFNGSGNNYAIRRIYTGGSRVIQAGDYIEYDVWIDVGAPVTATYAYGGCRVNFTDATSNAADGVDQNGYSTWAPQLAVDALARGVWYHRKSSLATHAGKTFDNFEIVEQGDAVSGEAKVLYKNIGITNGSGTTHVSIYGTSGNPQTNADGGQSLVTNVQCGPANSMLVYQHTVANPPTQVAADVRWLFKGL